MKTIFEYGHIKVVETMSRDWYQWVAYSYQMFAAERRIHFTELQNDSSKALVDFIYKVIHNKD